MSYHADKPNFLEFLFKMAKMTLKVKVKDTYHKFSSIRRALVGNKIVDHSDEVGASPVGAAQITYSFSNLNLASMDWAKTITRRDDKHLCIGIGCVLY